MRHRALKATAGVVLASLFVGLGPLVLSASARSAPSAPSAEKWAKEACDATTTFVDTINRNLAVKVSHEVSEWQRVAQKHLPLMISATSKHANTFRFLDDPIGANGRQVHGVGADIVEADGHFETTLRGVRKSAGSVKTEADVTALKKKMQAGAQRWKSEIQAAFKRVPASCPALDVEGSDVPTSPTEQPSNTTTPNVPGSPPLLAIAGLCGELQTWWTFVISTAPSALSNQLPTNTNTERAQLISVMKLLKKHTRSAALQMPVGVDTQAGPLPDITRERLTSLASRLADTETQIKSAKDPRTFAFDQPKGRDLWDAFLQIESSVSKTTNGACGSFRIPSGFANLPKKTK